MIIQLETAYKAVESFLANRTYGQYVRSLKAIETAALEAFRAGADSDDPSASHDCVLALDSIRCLYRDLQHEFDNTPGINGPKLTVEIRYVGFTNDAA